MEPALVGALAGAGAGALASAATRFVLDRRGEHAEGRAVARLIFRELEDIKIAVDRSIENDFPWEGGDFGVPTWGEHRYKVAGELDESELLVLSTTMNWIAQANAWRHEFLARPKRQRRAGLTSGDVEFLRVVSMTLDLACKSVGPLRRGRRFFVFRRRVAKALVPRHDLVCTCGDDFAAHEWMTKRRILRLPHAWHSHHDVGGKCLECDCARFEYAGDGKRRKRRMRRLHLAPPGAYAPIPRNEPVTSRNRGYANE